MTPANLLSEWSRLFVESLVDAGLREIVVSPGSRSTPLVWAALKSPRLRARSIIDERVAGFYALGRAKLTGRPAAVLCTSGSAAANYFPAIVEASLSHTPLLVITADRPFSLMDSGASQTIDQTKMFGGYVRRFVELGAPDGESDALHALRRQAAQSLHDARFPLPGPVHVNFRAGKPLEPRSGQGPEAERLTRAVDALLSRPCPEIAAGTTLPPDDVLERIAESCLSAERGLIVCGPASPSARSCGDALGRLARALSFPLYAEATSQHRFPMASAVPGALVVDALDTLLRAPTFLAQGAPDVVLQIGAAPISSAWERHVAATPGIRRHVITAHGYPDPSGTAETVLVADVATSLSRLASLVERRSATRPTSRVWAAHVATCNDAAWRAVDAALDSAFGLSEGAAVRAVIERLPDGAVLAVGNSLPVRHVDTFCRTGAAQGITVVSQRGAAGIDGVVSSAAGSADVAERPTVLLVGDVSALHDLGGFAVARTVKVPFVVVVLNNDGGRIFEQLPLSQAGLAEEAWPFWTTPHGQSFEAAAALFGLPYALARTEAELVEHLCSALERPSATLLEVKVAPHGAKATSDALAQEVGRALAALLPELTAR